MNLKSAGGVDAARELWGCPCRLQVRSLLLALFVLRAMSMAATAAPARWAVPDAPYRAVIKLSEAPQVPAAGVAVTLPEFGVTMERLADVVMTDANGEAQALTPVWRGLGQEALLLAQNLRPGSGVLRLFWRQSDPPGARPGSRWSVY